MANFSHIALQQALYQTLSGDATLAALVTGVADRPVQGMAYPYVVLGDATGTDWSSRTTTGTEYMTSVQVWSREGGRTQAATIMGRIYTLLHDANISVSGQTLVMLRFAGSGLSLEDDGWTYQGVMRFHALLQSN